MRQSVTKTDRAPVAAPTRPGASPARWREGEADEMAARALRKSGSGVDRHALPRIEPRTGASASHGQPLETPVRELMEPRFGWDFGAVRIHADAGAADAADALSAQAFAHGSDIYFARGSFAPETAPGMHLLAHELAHVIQQRGTAQPTIQRQPKKAAPKGDTVKLGGGKHKIRKNETLATIAEAVYGSATFWSKIKSANPAKVHGATNAIVEGEELTLPLLDVNTLAAMQGLEKQQVALRDLAKAMTEDEYKAFLKALPAAEKEKNAVLLQIVEMMRKTGMTFDEMAEDQKKFLEAEAKTKGVTVGEYVKSIIETGYGGAKAKAWDALSDAEKKAWEPRFDKVVKAIEKSPPADIATIIATAKKNGGGFKWDPAEAEKNNAFAYTQNDWKLHCGTRFVEAAEKDVAAVHPNIAHEMGGHNFYGKRMFGNEIQKAALEKVPKAEKDKALAGGNSLFSAYGYMETEIFAELYEFQFDSDTNPTDRPFDVDPKGKAIPATKKGDVPKQLKRIKAAFAKEVAKGLVFGLARRVEIDPRITAQAKKLFKEAVKTVFGFDV